MTLKVGLVGCGRISDIYLKNCARLDGIEVAACASLDLAESRAKAKKFGIEKSYMPADLISDPEIDIVLNLTVPSAHAEISIAALKAGKHVYAEKPFVTSRDDGEKILQLARQKTLLVGNAPDTFLGGRWQTCRKLIDDGVIGKPTGFSAFVGTHGVERHHPNPDFYYQFGGGPLLDLGPYYLTALVFLLGPISHVSGIARRTFDHRTIENGERTGEQIKVEVDTHSIATLKFENGTIGSMTMSFDVWDSETPRLEIYGEEGTICIPDPDPVHGANIFQGEVWYRTKENSRWSHQPRPIGRDSWQVAQNAFGFNEDYRGLGLWDLANALREGRQPRASGELAMHVFEAMDCILTAQKTGQQLSLKSRVERPQPMPIIPPQDAPDQLSGVAG